MKNLRRIYPLTILLLCSIIGNAQKPLMDSIRVQIGNTVELELATNDYKDLGENVSKDLKSLQSILKDYGDIPKGTSYSISYKPGQMMSVKPTGPNERIIWENDGLTRYQFNNGCSISSDNYYLLIRFNEIESLMSDLLITQIKEAIDSTRSNHGRFAATYNYTFQGARLIHNKQRDKLNGQLDALSLKGGVGVNLIKNQPVMDLSAEVGLIFSKHGILKNNYYVSYNQLSDFTDDSKINLNGFLNAGYRYNLSNSRKNTNWLGLEFGYLVSRHGDLFEKNTFKLGVNWEIGKYISVSPQLYFSGDSTYPAVRIGFGF